MKKLLTITAAVSALAVAAPAAAQWSNQGYANANAGGSVGMSNRIEQLQARLQAGVQSGAITRQEAQTIRPQLRQLRDLERQYSVNGLDQQERQALQQRIRSVRQQLRVADGGNRTYDQYSEYDDGYTGQGGPYEQVEEVCDTRSGIGGVIDSVLGRSNCSGIQVGQRVSGSGLYSLPYEYRNQYRDTANVYYRTDGRQIYQIDARTGTVARVYNMNR
jgi:hypothetical protein